MNTELLGIGERLLSGSLNGLYQGLLVTLVVAVVLRCLRRTNAATRHATWLCTLLVVVTLLLVHCVGAFSPNHEPTTTGIPSSPSLPPASSANEAQLSSRDNVSDLASTEARPVFRTETASASARSPDDANVPAWVQEWIGEITTDGQEAGVVIDDSTPSETTAARLTAAAGIVFKAFRSALAQRMAWRVSLGQQLLSGIGWLLLAGWVVVALIGLARLAQRLVAIRQLKQRSQMPRADLLQLFLCLRERLQVRRRVRLRVNHSQKSALLLGFVHPVILLPDAESTATAEPVLRHEFAHLNRRDDWVNLAQHTLEAILFFHPAVWWISRQLSLEREIACDDHVLAQIERPRSYALLLADLAGRMQGPALLAPGMSANKSQLQRRIDMILDTQRNASPRLARTKLGLVASAAVVLALVASYAAPRVVLAKAPTAANQKALTTASSEDAEVPATAEAAVLVTAEGSGDSSSASASSSSGASVSVGSGWTIAATAPASVSAGAKIKSGEVLSAGTVVLAAPSAAAAASAPTAPAATVYAIPGEAPVAAVTLTAPALAPTPPGAPIALATPAPAAGAIALTLSPTPPTAPVAIAAPTPPTPPVVRWAPTPRVTIVKPPLGVAAPKPIIIARAPEGGEAKPTPAKDSDGLTVEERLKRLEALVQKLRDQQKLKMSPDQSFFQWRGPNEENFKAFQKDAQKLAEEAGRSADVHQKDMEKMQADVRRQIEKAQREAQMAAEQGRRAAREAAREAARAAQSAQAQVDKKSFALRSGDNKEKKVQDVRRQLEQLQRERDRLDRQIEKLEHQQEQLDEDQAEEQEQDQNQDQNQDQERTENHEDLYKEKANCCIAENREK